MNRLVINSNMNFQGKQIINFTLDDSPEIIVNQLAFLSVMRTWNKGFGSWDLIKQFNKEVDNKIGTAHKLYMDNPKGAVAKLNILVNVHRGHLRPVGPKSGDSVDPLETVQEMAYQKPNFENFWDRAKQNTFINSLGIDRWIELAQTGKASKISKPSLDNILDYDPSVDPKPNLNTSHINMPMILKTPMGDYHLLSGNAELKGIMDMHGNAKVWFIDGSQVEA